MFWLNSFFRVVIFFLFSGVCYGQNIVESTIKHDSIQTFTAIKEFQASEITYNIFSAQNNSWGYDILLDGRVFIHQPCKPGLAGNEGFKSKRITRKVAHFVINKIKKGEFPPSITINELKKLNAL
jgi:hypothetical protein